MLMIIGGFSNGHPTNAVYTYNVKTKHIKEIVGLNKNRYAHSCTAAVMEGQEYVFAAGNFFCKKISWRICVMLSAPLK